MPVKIWPREFEKKDHINAAERFLLRNAMRNLKEGCFAIGIDPVGFATDKVHMGMYISPNEGLITFSIVRENLDPAAVAGYLAMEKVIEPAIYERLLNSRLLIARSGDKKILKFPYKHIFIFPDEEIPVVSCDADTLLAFAPYSAVRFFIPTTAKNRPKFLKDLRMFDDIRMPYDSNFTALSDEECLAIFERLAPEYTVVLKEKDEVEVVETTDELPAESEEINGNEVEYRTFYLDDYQVALINDMGRGHRVMLANAGAGKSVLLLFLLFSVYETNYKIKQMQMGFDKLKNNYKDVFDEEELKELIGEDSFKNEIITKIKKQRNWAIVAWIILLIILLLVVEMISSDSTADRIVTLFARLKELKNSSGEP